MNLGPAIWVVTDQSRNHGPHVAGVEALARQLGLQLPVKHVFVDREKLRPDRAEVVISRLKYQGLRAGGDPVILFVDSECRDQKRLEHAQQALAQLAKKLQAQWPNTAEVVLNPMSEGALLLADEWLDLLRDELGALSRVDERLLTRLVADKRAGRAVNKDTLEDVARLAMHKRRINSAWAAGIKKRGLPPVSAPCYDHGRERITTVLAGVTSE